MMGDSPVSHCYDAFLKKFFNQYLSESLCQKTKSMNYKWGDTLGEKHSPVSCQGTSLIVKSRNVLLLHVWIISAHYPGQLTPRLFLVSEDTRLTTGPPVPCL